MIRKISYISMATTSLLLSACQGDVAESGNAVVSKVTPTKMETVTPQAQLNGLAKNLQVKYNFLSNVESDCPDLKGEKVKYCYSAEVQLSLPKGSPSYESNSQAWQLNYSQVYPSYASSSDQLNLRHLNGDMHQISPKANFTGFKAGDVHTVKLWVKSTLITESELMPNYWLASEGLTAAIVDSTRSQIDKDTGLELQPWVVPFTDIPKQIKSAPEDVNQYASSQWLYDNEPQISTDDSHVDFAIIPTPKSIKIDDEKARLDLMKGLNVTLTGNIKYSQVAAAFERLASLGVKESSAGVAVTIELNDERKVDWRSGHYQLAINDSAIIIKAQDSAGAFYGLQSLASLLTVGSTKVPLVTVEDQPHYDYRGQHVDVARNFHSKAFMFSLIKQMAAYKLNKLHLHLAEDEGWRLELPSLPELTQVGSKRCLDLSDTQCLQPQLGGGDRKNDGYYSISDYQDILRMATKHHIQVIPSLDMPGHSRAAIKAMEARYHYYMSKENETEAKRYLLTDFDDKTQYSSIQNYNDNTLNICMESTYHLC